MRFFTHIAAGLLLYTVLVWLLNQPYTLAGLMFVTIGSLIPDLIDQATGDHRGWGHSIIWIIPTIFIFIWNTQLGLGFMAGFMMHILFDAMTKKGVPFLYPFQKTRIVVPKKEKSRIQTGHKKEIALFIVVILILIPVSYGVLCGFPEIPGVPAKNITNSTNKTNSTPYKSLTSDYRSPSSYSSGKNPVSSGKTPTKSASSSNPSNSTFDEIDLDSQLQEWLNDNTETGQETNNQTQNNHGDETQNNSGDETQNQTNTIVDGLFGDLSFDNLPEGVQVETNMSMDEDTEGFFNNDTMTDNDESGYYIYDDNVFDDNSYDDFFMGLMGTLIVAGSGLIGKT